MLGLLILSILVATYVVPLLTAKVADPRRAFWLLLTYVLVAEMGYAFVLYFIYPRLLWS